jgi:hypothetical protein
MPGEIAYRIACCEAAAGDHEAAVAALRVALDRGMRDLARVRSEEYWEQLRADQRIDFELPYSKVRANAADLFWQTSWPTDYRIWIAPDIYAPPTFEAYRRNQDPALAAILAIREHVPG